MSRSKLQNRKIQDYHVQNKSHCAWLKAAHRKFSPQWSSNPAAFTFETNFFSGFRRPRIHARNLSWHLVVFFGLIVFPFESFLLMTVSKTSKADNRRRLIAWSFDFSSKFRFFFIMSIFSFFTNMVDIISDLSDEKQAQECLRRRKPIAIWRCWRFSGIYILKWWQNCPKKNINSLRWPMLPWLQSTTPDQIYFESLHIFNVPRTIVCQYYEKSQISRDI